MGLQEVKCKLSHWIWKAWQDIVLHHQELLKKSWKNSMLLKKIDGSEDMDAKALYDLYNVDDAPLIVDFSDVVDAYEQRGPNNTHENDNVAM